MPPSEAHGSTRSTPKILLLVAAVLLVARVASGIIDETHPEKRAELIDWTAPSAAPDAARSSGRLILYAFTGHDRASRRFSGDLFTNAEVAKQIENRFVPVQIAGGPASDTPETAALRARFGVKSEPALVVTNADGSKVQSVPVTGGTAATLQALSQATMEVMDIPFQRGGRSFRFQFGGHRGAAGVGPLPPATGEADSTARFR